MIITTSNLSYVLLESKISRNVTDMLDKPPSGTSFFSLLSLSHLPVRIIKRTAQLCTEHRSLSGVICRDGM